MIHAVFAYFSSFSVPYDFLVQVTIILNVMQKLTSLLHLFNIRKSVFSDARTMSPGRRGKTSKVQTPRTVKKLERK